MGCVIVCDGEIVSEIVGCGFYFKVGEFYVEVFVLCEVGEWVCGVIVYVMFELCSYDGCILFCVDVLIVVGVVCVVVVVGDFNL